MCGDRLFFSSPVVTAEQYDKIAIENNNNHHGFLLKTDIESGDRFSYFVSSRRPNLFRGSGVFFGNLEPNNYGSFLFRVLPQMLFFADMNIDFDFYVTSGRTSWFLEALKLAQLPIRPVFAVADIVGDQFESLFAFSEFCIEGWFDKETNKRLLKLVQKASEAARLKSDLGERLYVSRLLGGGARPHYRRLVNEKELANRAEARGFKVVFPETLLFRDQIVAFSRARVVVGPSGSGMLNAMFSPSGAAVVDMESFHNTVRQHARIYSSTGKAYSFLFGTIENKKVRVAFSDWKVNEDLFDRWLSENV
jgi:capsular polysaccharide biosynthesis protein